MDKTEKFVYTFSENGICKDVCSYIRTNRIGSSGCTVCDYCLSHNPDKNYVLCGFKSGTKQSEGLVKIYIAGALFSVAEQKFNELLTLQLESRIPNILIHLPQKECKGLEFSQGIYDNCIQGIDDSDVLIAILEGTQVDDGTAVEIGYASAKGKIVIGVRSDFRSRGDDSFSGLNCMISKSLYSLINVDNMTDIVDYLVDIIKDIKERQL